MKFNKIGYMYILIAGLFWSILGFFVTKLTECGFTSFEIIFFRLGIGFISIAIFAKLRRPELLKIKRNMYIYVVLIAIFVQVVFNIFYLKAINSVGTSTAAVLLYTSPLFVALFSKLIYKERINFLKIISLIVCFLGAFITVTEGKLNYENLNLLGIVFGIIAAIAYSLFSIFGKKALEEMDNLTMIAYSFLIGALIILLKIDVLHMISCINNLKAVLLIIAFGVITGALAYISYSIGVKKGVELSVAGVLASVELIFAVLIGWTLLGEQYSFIKLIGIIFMAISMIIALRSNKQEVKENIVEELSIKNSI